MLRQLAARPCHLISLTSSSLVSMTMSRQLLKPCGCGGRDLCEADSPAAGAKDSLFLALAPGAFSEITGAGLDTDVQTE